MGAGNVLVRSCLCPVSGLHEMTGIDEIPDDIEDRLVYWRTKAMLLERIARVTDGLVYTLKADVEEHWTVSFVDGTLPVEHPFRTDTVGGKRIEDIIPPAVFAHIKPALRAAFRGEKSSYEVEYASGRWLQGTVKPFVRDSHGRVIEIIASNGDVTARKFAESEREEQRIRLEALVRALPDLVFIFDRQGIFVGYNIGHEDDLLTSPAQFVGCSLEDIMPVEVADEAKRVMDMVSLTGNGGEFKYALSINGVENYFHARMVSLGDDKIMAVVRKITDLVLAERDERIATAHLEAASRVAGLGYWAWDPVTKVMTWSPEVFRMLKVEGDQVPPLEKIPALIGADVLARIRSVGLDAILSGEFKQIEFTIDRGGGDVRHFLTSMAMADDSVSGGATLRGALQEITEVRRLEAQLLQAQKMESIGRFAGAIAHDFNNMLQVIKGYGEVLRKSLAGNPQSSGYVDAILGATDKAGDLVSRILAFSRQSDMARVEVAIDAVVTELSGMLEPLIGRAVTLEVISGCGPARCSLDRSAFEQVLVNLAVNARDAMPDGGRLRIKTSIISKGSYLNEARIAWPWLVAREYVLIDVTDTGSGIPVGIGDRIFEPFFTTKAVGVGTGLGLSTAYSIIRRHDGVLHVLRTGTDGTTFRIVLPVVTAS